MCVSASFFPARGRTEKVRQLLAGGADIEERGIRTASPPLHYASSGGHEAVVFPLLERGADVSARTKRGQTPEDLATARSEHSIAAMLRAEAGRRAQKVADPRSGVQEERRPRRAQVANPPEARKATISECGVLSQCRLFRNTPFEVALQFLDGN